MGEKALGRKRKIRPMYIEPELYPSFVGIVEAMNDKIRKLIVAQKYEYNGIYVSVEKITQKNAIFYLRINQCS